MKLNKTFILITAFSSALFTGCVSEDMNTSGSDSENGKISINVAVAYPQKTKSIDADAEDFPVTITAEDGTVAASFDKASSVPSSITLAVGTYTASAHTPGEIAKKMDYAYYEGSFTQSVSGGLNTVFDITCKMKNSSIAIHYDPEFLEAFSSWDMTIDDGSETALSYSTSTTDPDVVYWYFENDAAKLNLNIKATTQKGKTVSFSKTLTKAAAGESYIDDNTNFTGGDAVVINLSPEGAESTTGSLTGVNVSASIVFSETGQDVVVNVTDNSPSTTDPSEGENTIVLNMPEDIDFNTIDESFQPSDMDVTMETPDGLKSLIVKITSSSADMTDALDLIGTAWGLDFANGTEAVGSTALDNFLNSDDGLGMTSQGQTVTMPKEGDTSYTFPVSVFANLLATQPGTHTFTIIVTDLKGNTKTGSFSITV